METSVLTGELLGVKKELYEFFENSNVEVNDGMKAYPEYILEIDRYFDYSMITAIKLGWSTFEITPDFGDISIGNRMFKNCKNLIEARYYKRIMGEEFFYGCEKLKIVPYYDHIQDMRKMFYGCKSLERVTIDMSHSADCYGAFYNCESLSEVRMVGDPANVRVLGDMFYGVKDEGVLYYDDRYDYNKIINILPENWISMPYTVGGD